MRYLLIVCLIACSAKKSEPPPPAPAAAAPPKTAASDPSTPTTAPASAVHAADGSTVDLASVWANKRVLLVFYMGAWCDHCKAQLAEIQKQHDKLTADGTKIIAVSNDKPEDAAKLKADLGLGFDIYSDPDLSTSKSWGVAASGAPNPTPYSFVIQPGGAVTYHRKGMATMDELIAAVGSGGH